MPNLVQPRSRGTKRMLNFHNMTDCSRHLQMTTNSISNRRTRRFRMDQRRRIQHPTTTFQANPKRTVHRPTQAATTFKAPTTWRMSRATHQTNKQCTFTWLIVFISAAGAGLLIVQLGDFAEQLRSSSVGNSTVKVAEKAGTHLGTCVGKPAVLEADSDASASLGASTTVLN